LHTTVHSYSFSDIFSNTHTLLLTLRP